MKWFKKKKSDKEKQAEPDQSQIRKEAAPGEQSDVKMIEPEKNREAEALTDEPREEAGKPQLREELAQADHTKTEIETDREPLEKRGFFKQLKKGLSKTREILTTDIDDLFTGKRKLDDDLIEELEELLITSDIGVATTMDLIETMSKKVSKIENADQLKDFLKNEILKTIGTTPSKERKPSQKPHVVMVVGVNGVGKTTTIGKLAARKGADGKKVLIAAADTFRAAAIEQLSIWADRAGADIVKHRDNSDPAAVAYDSLEAAQARGVDIVYIDTAGRLHTKVNLMEEIKKVKRTVSKKIPGAPHEILLVLDATTGQNALSQANLFNEALDITGLALTKLDGTAKGGIVVGICGTLGIPLEYIGVGEGIDDLQEFDPKDFVEALF